MQHNPFVFDSVSGVSASGKQYPYNSQVTLEPNSLPYGSGNLAYAVRKEQAIAENAYNTRRLNEEDSDFVKKAGAFGEVAFAVAYNVPFSTEFSRAEDFLLNGKCIDVKTSPIRGNLPGYQNLLIAKRDFHPGWFYVAVQMLSWTEYRVLGYIHASELKDEWYGDPDGRGPRWLVKLKDLHPLPKLITFPSP